MMILSQYHIFKLDTINIYSVEDEIVVNLQIELQQDRELESLQV
jgi:hypothetical protein